MNGIQMKRFEMLKRVQEFGKTNGEVLNTSAVARELLAALDTAIDEIREADTVKSAASARARAGHKTAARRALVDLLQRGGQLARVLRAQGHTVPPCDPPASGADQALITAGRRLAKEAARFTTEFDGHALGAAWITEVTTAFEAASDTRVADRAEHIGAMTRIETLLKAAALQVRRLDLIVSRLYAGDAEALKKWKRARPIQQVRGPRSGEAEAPAVVADTPAESPAVDPVTTQAA